MRLVSFVLSLSLTACAPAATTWLTVDQAHAKPKKKGKKKDVGAADAATGATPAKASSMSSAKGAGVRPTFAWTAGWSGTYEYTNVVERNDGFTEPLLITSSAAVAVDVTAHNEDLAVRIDTLRAKGPTVTVGGKVQASPSPPGIDQVLQAASTLPYTLRIGPSDGAVKGLLADAKTGKSYEDQIQAAIAGVNAKLSDDDRAPFEAMMTQLKPVLSTQSMLTTVTDLWSELVTRWDGNTYELGQDYALTWNAPSPYAAPIPQYAHSTLKQMEPCHDGPKAPSCGRLVITIDADPIAFQAATQAEWDQRLEATGTGVTVAIQQATEQTTVELLAELDTLRPWRLDKVVTTKSTVGMQDQVRESSQTDTTSYVFEW